ncbi:hypothetical protein EYF80_042295 [Liparis tanakae]|uniref:Uncharacterized protein n=1 Tax=Liparis tanakae TaxID=230148 RepID=A0A4Z2G1U0_9TELE|nr:hypothetical protein EYF80_042295 [Liparis tanakae]
MGHSVTPGHLDRVQREKRRSNMHRSRRSTHPAPAVTVILEQRSLDVDTPPCYRLLNILEYISFCSSKLSL